jgi:flagellar biosynthetic protein FliP
MNLTATHIHPRPTASRLRRMLAVVVLLAVAALAFASPASAVPGSAGSTGGKATSATTGQPAGQGAGAGAGNINVQIGTGSNNGGKGTSTAIQLLVLLTVLALAPSILIMTTGFTRILIVLGFVRNALGTPTMPPNQVLVGLSLFLTIFVMAPTFSAVNKTALQPYQEQKISQQQAIARAQVPVRKFMFRQVSERDLAMFVRMADMPRPKTRADVPTYVLVPAFLISELKTAFQIGFLIFIPFLIIDMVVASTLMSMGMIMLPPVMISLPFKILLFVLVDGWGLIVKSLLESYGGAG